MSAAKKKIVVPAKTTQEVPVQGLVKPQLTNGSMIAATKDAMSMVLAHAAEILTKNLQPPELCEVFVNIKGWDANIKDLQKNGRDRLLDLVLEHGDQTSEAGTKKAEFGSWEVEARPRRSGIDGKKLEALIRAKGLAPATYMSQVITFEPSETGIQQLIQEGKVSPEEMTTCHHELEFNLMSPKKVR